MSARPNIICACGRRIEGREVLQQGYFMSRWKPVWVLVKYRCSRCRMLGEQLIDYSQWDGSVLECDAAEPSADEAASFRTIHTASAATSATTPARDRYCQ